MGFFDIFLSEEKKIAKNRHRLTSRDSQAEDREAAARWLAQNGAPVALLALLSRFDMKLEHQLNDKTEKEFVYGLVVGLGDAMVKPLRSWLKQCRQVHLPLRAYEELTSADEALAMVTKLLEVELARDDFKPEKKHALLVWLAERRGQGVLEAAAPFLSDFDENVRCVALEAVVLQADERAAPLLEAALVRDGEDSNRLRHRIAEVLVQRRWAVQAADAVGAALPTGFAVREGRVVAA